MTSLDGIGAEGLWKPEPLQSEIQRTPTGAEDQAEQGFTNHITDALGEVADLRQEVKDKSAALARGEAVPLHDLMISMSKSEVAFNMMVEVRNKLLEAWQAVSRSA